MNDKHIFFNFLTPFLNYVDSGDFFRKPFSILFKVVAILHFLLVPIVIINLIEYEIITQSIPWFFLSLIFLLFSVIYSWLMFQLWWNRSIKLAQSSRKEDEFTVTPVFSHFIQTAGEYYGFSLILLAVFSIVIGLLFFLFFDVFGFEYNNYNYYDSFRRYPPPNELNFINLIVRVDLYGVLRNVVFGFFGGYLVIMITRFIAEQFKVFVTIANNTKSNTKNSEIKIDRTDKNLDAEELFEI